MVEDIDDWITARRAAFDGHARLRLESGAGTGVLADALRAGVLRPGKRYRPLLMLAVAESHGVAPNADPYGAVLDAALAAECFHAASLIYDDLPAMDNADRRGDAPSMHRALEMRHPGRGAALATLAAHALTSHGFTLLATLSAAPAWRAEAVAIFARAIGFEGMAGGQAEEFAGPPPAPPPVGDEAAMDDYMTRTFLKTSPLFGAAASVGALLAGAPDAREAPYYALGLELGSAYQLADDLRDVREDQTRGLRNPACADPAAARGALRRRLRHAREFPARGVRASLLYDFLRWFAAQCEKALP